jgi:hypothetical protein
MSYFFFTGKQENTIVQNLKQCSKDLLKMREKLLKILDREHRAQLALQEMKPEYYPPERREPDLWIAKELKIRRKQSRAEQNKFDLEFLAKRTLLSLAKEMRSGN